jgi:osmotically inducible lipoprotein OsmB
MKTFATIAFICLLSAVISACDNMTTRQRDTAIGAAGGGLAGALLGGGTLGTLGGAAAGGIIGNQVGK